MLKNLKNKKGFTLVELIIVIAILGILMLIAVPYLLGIQQRFQVNADKKSAAQIGKAARVWYTEYRTDKGFRVDVAGTEVDGDTDGSASNDGPVYASASKVGAIPEAGMAMAQIKQVKKLDDYVDLKLKPTSLKGSNEEPDATQDYFIGLVGSASTKKIIVSIAPSSATLTIPANLAADNATTGAKKGDPGITAADVAYDGEVYDLSDAANFKYALAYMEP